MRKKTDMWPYQQAGERHIIDNNGAALFMDMGLGKTVTTLTAINTLMNDHLEVSKTLVIAPLRVAEDTWPSEIENWEHLRHLRISVVLGSEKARTAALKAKADIYVINRENVAWLVSFYGSSWPFDMLVVDELSSFKSAKSQRFKALKMVLPKVKRRLGLTGTPQPNGLPDLWSQIFILDRGERLGKTQTAFREAFLIPNKRNGSTIFSYKIANEQAEQEIHNKIADICLSMKKEDYLQLPPRIDSVVPVHLEAKAMEGYYEFEREQVLQLFGTGEEITAVNKAALYNKLLQYANGAIYTQDRNWTEVHTAKLDALAERLEAANGSPVMVFYQYQHDLERIMQRFKSMKPVKIQDREDIARWNAGKIPLFLAHAASAGHGLNLQHGGHYIEWFGCPWSLELYMQGCTRIDRQGQKNTVFNNRLVSVGTLDEVVITSLDDKFSGQERLFQATKALINKYLS